MEYVGYASGVNVRTELSGRDWVSILDFRIERFDDDGNPLPRVPVAMKSVHFDSWINNDDRVKVSGNWREGGTLWVDQIHNLETAAVIRNQVPGHFLSTLASIVGTLIGLAILGAIVVVAWLLFTNGLS
jgi:hypothetical protein